MLPMETCIQIMELAFDPDDDSVDYKALSTYALVCWSWAKQAQKLLFRSIDMRKLVGSRRSEMFMSSVRPSSREGSTLGSYVRVLSVRLGAHWDATLGTIDTRRFALLLSRCPQLHKLALDTHRLQVIEPSWVENLRSITNEVNLQVLHFTQFDPLSFIAYQLVPLWPTIRSLVIGHNLPTPPPPKSPDLRLSEVRLHVVNIPPECLTWLLSGSETSLRLLDIINISKQLVGIVVKYSSHLRSLYISQYNKGAAEVLRHCRCLEELVIHQVVDSIRIEDIPTTIKHFSFDGPLPADEFHSVMTVIESLPELKFVTCHRDDLEPLDFSSLQRACYAREVRLGSLGSCRRRRSFNFYHE